MRFGHGELHLALLGLMSQRPMHGYELMAELSTRMGRKYRASPGSIYPAVQALENRAHRLAALESRLGVRFTRGVDPDLARFAERVRAVAPRLPEPVLSNAIDVAASEIERMADERGDSDE
jgi:hypothetical protein